MKGVNFINQGRAEAQRPKKKKKNLLESSLTTAQKAKNIWAKEGDPANKIIFESPPTKNMRRALFAYLGVQGTKNKNSS